jgi:hypothetical protein
LFFIRESTLERNHKNGKSVANLLLMYQNLFNITEFTL